MVAPVPDLLAPVLSVHASQERRYGVNSREVLVIIPARGGSKSIPRKNIRNFAGFPLIAWSIAAAKQAKSVTRVIVSTDDREIAEVAKRWGAEVPFLRPAKLAQDDTPDLPVFEHGLTWLAKHEQYRPEVVVQLRPTSPIRPTNLVDQAVAMLIKHSEADSVRGVVPSGQNPYKMWQLTQKGYLSPLLKVLGIVEPYNAPRQKLPATYWQTGHIDAIRPGTIHAGSMSGKRIFPLIIDPAFTVDLDTEYHWSYAAWMVDHLKLPFVRPNKRC